MQKRRVMTIVIGAVLSLGVLAAAQAPPYAIKAQSDFVEAAFERGVVTKRQRSRAIVIPLPDAIARRTAALAFFFSKHLSVPRRELHAGQIGTLG